MAKPKTIVKWVPVDPDGNPKLDHAGSSEETVRRGLTDDMRQWRELEAEGWTIIQIRIEPIKY